MSKARAKGTRGENRFLPRLRLTFYPDLPVTDKLADGDTDHPLQRAPLKGIADAGDYTGVPWLHEAKNTDVPHFLQWAKTCNKKHARWAILWSGDLRRHDGPFVMLPLDFYLELAATSHHGATWQAIASLGERLIPNPYPGTSGNPYPRGSSVHTDAEGFVIDPLHMEEG